MVWACSECEFVNPVRAARCKSCDRVKPGARSGRDIVTDDQCTWAWGPGRRCSLRVEGWPGQNPIVENRRQIGWCAWHLDVKTRPRWADDFEEFERWWRHWYERPVYCAAWTHFPIEELWRAVQGEVQLSPQGVQCRASNCVNLAELPYGGPWPPPKAMWRQLYDQLDKTGRGVEAVPL